MKKIMLVLGSLGSVAAFAEGTTTTMDTTAAETIVNSASTGLQSLLTAVVPYVTAVLLAGLAIWAGIAVIRIVKRAFSNAK